MSVFFLWYLFSTGIHVSSVPTTHPEQKLKGCIQRSAHPSEGQIPIVSGHKGPCCLYVCRSFSLLVSVLVRRRRRISAIRPFISLQIHSDLNYFTQNSHM